MIFNRYKNKIKELQKDLTFWQKTCDELQNTINDLRKENENFKNINHQLNDQLINMQNLSQENEIMRKYYKLDEEPSSDVQAKVLADLRLHDMEFKMIQDKFNYYNLQLALNKQQLALNSITAAHLLPLYY